MSATVGAKPGAARGEDKPDGIGSHGDRQQGVVLGSRATDLYYHAGALKLSGRLGQRGERSPGVRCCYKRFTHQHGIEARVRQSPDIVTGTDARFSHAHNGTGRLALTRDSAVRVDRKTHEVALVQPRLISAARERPTPLRLVVHFDGASTGAGRAQSYKLCKLGSESAPTIRSRRRPK